MSAEDVVGLLDRLDGIEVCPTGVVRRRVARRADARARAYLDLVAACSDAPLLSRLLGRDGYEVAKGQLPTCVVLLDPAGRQVDVHPVEFDDAGDGIYRMEDGRDWAYLARGFAGKGRVLGREVRCLTPEVQVLCHAGYELAETDHHDLAVLRTASGSVRNVSEVAASRARSISGSTAKNEPTTTAVQATTAADNASPAAALRLPLPPASWAACTSSG